MIDYTLASIRIRGPLIILAGLCLISFVAGVAVEKAMREPTKINVDADPGIIVKVSTSTPTRIECRLPEPPEVKP